MVEWSKIVHDACVCTIFDFRRNATNYVCNVRTYTLANTVPSSNFTLVMHQHHEFSYKVFHFGFRILQKFIQYKGFKMQWDRHRFSINFHTKPCYNINYFRGKLLHKLEVVSKRNTFSKDLTKVWITRVHNNMNDKVLLHTLSRFLLPNTFN